MYETPVETRHGTFLLPPPPLHVGETLVNVENAFFRPTGVARVNNETAHFVIITARPEVNQPRVEHLLNPTFTPKKFFSSKFRVVHKGSILQVADIQYLSCE